MALLRGAGAFRKSGLSNICLGDCNEFTERDRLTCTLSEAAGGNCEARHVLDGKLEWLRATLERHLGREGPLVLAEQYYSISPPGTFLQRHMDERHEETKGKAAYTTAMRRSVSWLVYLSADGWGKAKGCGAGGALRAYCRRGGGCGSAGCGAHGGDLQVGWLADCSNDDEPVFLDAWVKVKAPAAAPQRWLARSALYCMRGGARHYLTESFGPESSSWPFAAENPSPSADVGLEPADFAAALSAQLPAPLRRAFSGTEEVPHARQHVHDVLPEAGTLVFFDSVAVPHEVLVTTAGERLAMAGWFHEPQQPFPDWFGS